MPQPRRPRRRRLIAAMCLLSVLPFPAQGQADRDSLVSPGRPVDEAAQAAQAEAERAATAAADEAARVAAEEEARRLAEEEAARLAAIAAATEACLATAGAPSARVPVSQEAQRAQFEALREARGACTEAVELDAEAGGPLFHLATIAQVRAEHREAIELYRRSAEAGIGPAHTRLGDYYNFGIGPIRADLDRALGHYRDAVALGDPAGTATLAFMYQLGRGVTRDPARMVELFEQAARQGYHFAEFRLAIVYLTGEGVPDGADPELGIPNARRAVPLLSAAARQGNIEAALALAQLYATGAERVPANPALRYRWTDAAARAGHPQAIAARGYLYEQGIGIPANPDRAAASYIAALETGEVAPEGLRVAGGPDRPEWEDATARAFQTILAERGLYTGPIDGIVGRGTMGAARELGN